MKKILIVDDEKWFIEALIDRLAFEGYETLYANSCDEALSLVKSEGANIKVMVVDSFLPVGDKSSFLERQNQFSKIIGIELAKYISSNYKSISIIGYSQLTEAEIVTGFRKNGFNFISKTEIDSFNSLCHLIKIEFKSEEPSKIKPNIFIVHGHDEKTLLELKNYLQNTLDLGEPIILKEKPNSTMAIIEKFEKYSKDIDLVFVLLTPDDIVTIQKTNTSYNQPRPNVLFELGYFLGRLRRTDGKVIILAKSQTNILSDLSGILFIDISNGIHEAGELIRREIHQLK